jgi:hypothetical protein
MNVIDLTDENISNNDLHFEGINAVLANEGEGAPSESDLMYDPDEGDITLEEVKQQNHSSFHPIKDIKSPPQSMMQRK